MKNVSYLKNIIESWKLLYSIANKYIMIPP